ncbi:MAG: BrnT family toxin [Desulfovibrionales bacterium]|nr:BrnT family toxin [Desulfovibrionales bacterium]
MHTYYFWDNAKRQSNLEKHGLDFIDADLVLENRYRLDVPSERNGEARIQSFAYVFEVLTVLTVVFLPGEQGVRIISFRRANRTEKEVYYAWLQDNGDDG